MPELRPSGSVRGAMSNHRSLIATQKASTSKLSGQSTISSRDHQDRGHATMVTCQLHKR
jgi:hypothetical protein